MAPPPDAPAAPAARIRRLHTSHRFAGLSAGQVLAWQAAVLAVWLAPAGPPRYGALGAAVVVVLLTARRSRGEWWYQHAGRWMRCRWGGGEQFAAAPQAAPDKGAEAVALAWDGGAWVAVLALRVEAPPLETRVAGQVLDFATVAGLLGNGVCGVRLVMRGHGGDIAGVPEPALCGEPTTAGGAQLPGSCRAWLALRGPTGLAGEAFDGTLLRRRAARATRLLSAAGLVATALDGPGLRRAVAEAAGGEDGTTEQVRPDWTHCRRGEVAEVCYRLHRPVPPGHTLGDLYRGLAEVPADAVTVALDVTERQAPEVGVRMDVRLSFAPGRPVNPARAVLERVARDWRPVRRDGEHAVALPDTLPFGGRSGEADLPGYAVEVAGNALDTPLWSNGLVAGYAPDGAAVLVNLSAPGSVRRLGVLAQLPVAQLLAFRALSTGAAVLVRTARPDAWGALAATVPAGRLSVVGPADPVVPHVLRPTIVVQDDPRTLGATPFGAPAAQLPYPVIELLPVLTARTIAALRGFDLLALPRTTQIDALRSGYDLPAKDGRWLARLPADVLALAQRGRVTYARAYRADRTGGQPQRERA